ncbi:MAG: glycosyltransferase family 2 protein [Actinomycetota bacterium]|nr:glycosyltransferase family 2 protein [Actinomycetota bacterium]
MTGPAGRHRAQVTVIVPTHDHAGTVDLACQSVLDQSVRLLELVVIGDGATRDVRQAVTPLLSDRRVSFIDRPKTPSRAELVRHEVLSQATTPYICYLGDDDIMLPDHVASTVDWLQSVDFTHPLPVFIDRRGQLRAHVTDLADPRCRLWHQHPFRNAVSLTGVGHRLDAYRRLGRGWREAPPGRWSDHYMWEQWFAHPGFRYGTGDRLTVLKFEASERGDMAPAERREEVMAWLQRSRSPGFAPELDAATAAAGWRAAVQLRLALDAQADQSARDQEALAAREAEFRAAQRQATTLRSELGAIHASRTWRARNRLVGLPLLGRLSRR